MLERTFTKGLAPLRKADWKTKRRIMRSFKMGEISGVDDPAQEGARVIMHKRFEPDGDGPVLAFVKVAFKEALDQRMIDQRFCEAFYDATKGKWQIDDAFQQALKDGDQPAEDAIRQYVDEVTALAQSAASATRTLGKSADFSHTINNAVAKAIDNRKETPMIKTLADLKAAIKNYDPASATAAIEATVIGAAASALGAAGEAELPADGPLSKKAPATDPTVTKMAREIAVLKLAPTRKAHFDTLDETAQTAFLAMSESDQDGAIEKANATDPVVYKCKDGTEIRKSDGVVAAMMAKRIDGLETDLEKSRTENADAAFEKSAREDFGNLPTDGTVELLKAAAAITDADKKKKMLDALRASNKAAAPRFQRLGSGGPVSKNSDPVAGEDPNDKLETLAKAHQSANPALSFAKAYDAVLKTDEGRSLYNETIGHEAE